MTVINRRLVDAMSHDAAGYELGMPGGEVEVNSR